jgi:RecQ-mediated genome instability protein 1
MDLNDQVRQALKSSHLPVPSTAWLTSLTTARSPPPPLPSLIATAKARLLAADLTLPGLLDPAKAASFPPSITNASTAQSALPTDIYVQVVDVENLTRSRWEQVEELEALERGEGTKGREIIRLPTAGADDNGVDLGDGAATQNPARAASVGPGGRASGSAQPKNATHRLVLQDCKGQNVYAVELKRIDKIGVGVTAIGEKMLLKRGAIVARGTLLLEPSNSVLLGGRIEAWQKPWLEGRIKRLKESVGADRPN